MVAYNFKPQFVEAVERGEKTQTIRRNGKRRHARPGDVLQLYTGQRTKACRLLSLVKCSSAEPIEIHPDGKVLVNGDLLNDVDKVQELAQADGFGNIPEFLRFFCPGDNPFKGVLIKWESP